MEPKITIGFEFTDEFGDNYTAKSTFCDYDGDTLKSIGMCLNNFLRQLTYVRNNDYIFMVDVDEEEYEELGDFLKDYREQKASGADDD